jgi:hypothetical protein
LTSSDGPPGKADARIVHILDWHFVQRDLFALDLRRTQPGVTEAGLEKAYAEHLATVEAVQVEQRELLAALLKEQGARAVLAEGLTPEGLETWRERVEWLREADEAQPKLRETRAEAERRGHTDLVKQADALLKQPRLDSSRHPRSFSADKARQTFLIEDDPAADEVGVALHRRLRPLAGCKRQEETATVAAPVILPFPGPREEEGPTNRFCCVGLDACPG